MFPVSGFLDKLSDSTNSLLEKLRRDCDKVSRATIAFRRGFKDLQANVAGNCYPIDDNNFIAAFGSQGYIQEFNKDGSNLLSIDPGGLIYQVMKL